MHPALHRRTRCVRRRRADQERVHPERSHSFHRKRIPSFGDHFAGVIKINLDEIAGFSTDEEAFLRLANGSETRGRVEDRPGQPLLVAGDAPSETAPSAIRQLWRTANGDPILLAELAEAEAIRKKWITSISFDLTGSSGNAEDFGLASQLKAAYGNKQVNTKFYLSYHNNNKRGETTTDESKAGAEHSSFVGEKIGWYVKTDLESDRLEDIDLRSTTAAGIKYALLDLDTQELDARAGLAYRFESYEQGNLDSPAVDLGLEHSYRLTELLSVVTDIDYIPSIEEFGDYRISQDSGIEMPLSKDGRWKLRTGLSNDYNSRPAIGRENLDLRYYTRLVFSWE